jgi:hypothetical protein
MPGSVPPPLVESTLIRVIWGWSDAGEQVYDLSGLPWDQQRAVREELKLQGGYVQDVAVHHPMQVLVAKELRERFENERQEREKQL